MFNGGTLGKVFEKLSPSSRRTRILGWIRKKAEVVEEAVHDHPTEKERGRQHHRKTGNAKRSGYKKMAKRREEVEKGDAWKDRNAWGTPGSQETRGRVGARRTRGGHYKQRVKETVLFKETTKQREVPGAS